MTDTNHSPTPPRRITIIGTGNVAHALGARWATHGHTITVAGRSMGTAQALAAKIAHGAVASPLAIEAVDGVEVVLLAVPWAAIDDVLLQLNAQDGALSGLTIIDPTNPVEHGVGRHLLVAGSVAERIASSARGAQVVKAFNVHPSNYWERVTAHDVVTLAGSSTAAVEVVSALVRDIGATPHTLGGLDRARQIEELGATVIALAFGGIDPRSAIPRTR